MKEASMRASDRIDQPAIAVSHNYHTVPISTMNHAENGRQTAASGSTAPLAGVVG